MRRVVSLLIVMSCATTARADGDATLATNLHDEAMQDYQQAKEFFRTNDFVAAAVMFDQAQKIFGRLERAPDGTIVDADAHAFRGAALSNMASAYAKAEMPVEALDAFVLRRQLFEKELSAADLEAIDAAIAAMKARIGTATFAGIPAGSEVKLDGRAAPPAVSQRAPAAPLRMAEGGHALEVRAPGFHPYLGDFTIVPGREIAVTVKLIALQTPARVRIDSGVPFSHVTVDDTQQGTAPFELSLAPGSHHYVVVSEGYRERRGTFDAKPGESVVVSVDLLPRWAPLGFRLAPMVVVDVPVRLDTPVGGVSTGAGIFLTHDYLRFRNMQGAFEFIDHLRALNQIAIGGSATFCVDQLIWAKSRLAWCPATIASHALFGGHTDHFRSGIMDIWVTTSFELRRSHGFVRLSVGGGFQTYWRLGTITSHLLGMTDVGAQLSVGIDL